MSGVLNSMLTYLKEICIFQLQEMISVKSRKAVANSVMAYSCGRYTD